VLDDLAGSDPAVGEFDLVNPEVDQPPFEDCFDSRVFSSSFISTS